MNAEYVVPAFSRAGIWNAASGLDALDAWVDVVAVTTPPILAMVNAVDVARRSDPEAEAIWKGPLDGRYQDCLRITHWLADDGTLAVGWRPEDAARFLWAVTSMRVYEDLTATVGRESDSSPTFATACAPLSPQLGRRPNLGSAT